MWNVQLMFGVGVANPGAGDRAAVLFAGGGANTLIVTYTAATAVTLDALGVLTLDFGGFAASEQPLAPVTANDIAVVVTRGPSSEGLAMTAALAGRSVSLTPPAAVALAPSDTIVVTLNGVAVHSPEGGGTNLNFHARWSGIEPPGIVTERGIHIAVQPPASGKPQLPFLATWREGGGEVLISDSASVFDTTLYLAITSEATIPDVTGATFAISLPTVDDPSDPGRYDALCTSDDLAAIKPSANADAGWQVDPIADHRWMVRPKSAQTLPRGGQIDIALALVRTWLPPSAALVSIDCVVPGYESTTLYLHAAKVAAPLVARCDVAMGTDKLAHTFSGAPVTLAWDVDTAGKVMIGADPPPPDWTDEPRASEGTLVVHPQRTTIFTLRSDGIDRVCQTTVDVAPLGTVDLVAGPDRTGMPGDPVVLTCSLEMASRYTLTPDVVANGPGCARQSWPITVWPLKTTTFTLQAEGLGGSKTSNATVTVPPIGYTGIIRFGAVDGIWELDLGAGTMTRRIAIPEGAIVSDCGMFSPDGSPAATEFCWGYDNRPHLYRLDGAGQATVAQASPGGVHAVSVSGQLRAGETAEVCWSNVAPGSWRPNLPPAGMFRWRCAGWGSTAPYWKCDIYAGADCLSGTMSTDRFVFRNGAESTDFTIACRPTAFDLGPMHQLYWIDGEKQGLYCDQQALGDQPPAPQRLCDAAVAADCWSLVVDGQGRLFWFEDRPGGRVGLCCFDPHTGTRAVILYMPANHVPCGGGLCFV